VPSRGCCILVLAAGTGTRFLGSGHKLNARLGAAPVLAWTLRHALATQLRVVLVVSQAVRDEAGAALSACEQAVVDTASDTGWGMGDSIAAGVAASRDADGWLVLPGDMPFVGPATLQRVADALARSAVAYARHDGRRGHPVAFRSELGPELLALTGDRGARAVVARHDGVPVDVDEPGVLMDIDTLADLAAAQAHRASIHPQPDQNA
jgi:molybdenum cofactor cytidylyltransferase